MRRSVRERVKLGVMVAMRRRMKSMRERWKLGVMVE